MTRFLIIGVLLLAQTLLPAQDLQSERPLDPSSLPSTWWDQFVKDKSSAQKQSDLLLENLNITASKLTAENREKAEGLIDDIQVNLQSWLNIIDYPAPVPKPAPPLKDSYSIAQTREIYHQLQKHEVELKSKEEELNGLKQQLNTNQKRLDLARQGYQTAQERSQEKVLFGLQMLKLRPEVEVGNKKISLLEKSIQIEKEQLNNVREEIEAAKNRLSSAPSEELLYTNQLDLAKRIWDQSKKEQQQQEISYVEGYLEETDEKSEIKNDLLTVRLINASIKELKSHARYLLLKLLQQLSLLLADPDHVEIDTLDRQIKEWKAQLKAFDLSLIEWRAQANRILQRATQVLTIEGQELPSDHTQLNQLVAAAQNSLLEMQKLSGEINEMVFILDLLESKSVSLRGQGEQWIKAVADFLSGVWGGASELINKTLFYIGTHPVTFMTMIEFLLIMVATWWFSRLITGAINTFSRQRKGIRKALIYRLKRLIHYLILCIGGIIGLSWMGFDFSNLVLIAGALGVGLGFGLQNIFNNFLSGIIILFQSHLKVGDYIELDTGLRGEIREINVSSTVITTNDGVEVIIPNSEMVSNRIINWTLRDPYRRVHVPFSVAYGSDTDQVTKIIVETAKKVQSTLQRIGVREPQVFLMGLGDNGIEMELVVWVDEKWARRDRNTRSQYLFAIEKALKENGFEIPFPQRDLRLRSGFSDACHRNPPTAPDK